MTPSIITQTDLRNLLTYSPNTGDFTWLTRRGGASTNKAAGYLHASDGYIYIEVNGRRYSAHRLAWLYVHGEWPINQVDHINRIKTDNRIENLRDVPPNRNVHNTTHRIDNASGAIGVSFVKATKRWRARMRIAGGRKYDLGTYDTIDEAAQAYRAAARIFQPDRPI